MEQILGLIGYKLVMDEGRLGTIYITHKPKYDALFLLSRVLPRLDAIMPP